MRALFLILVSLVVLVGTGCVLGSALAQPVPSSLATPLGYEALMEPPWSPAELELQKKAEALRLSSIEGLKHISFTNDIPPDTKAEMLLRISDLYFSQGYYLYRIEGAQSSNAQDWFDKSIHLFQHILQNYPKYARSDEAVFYLGRALQLRNMLDEANTQFSTLVRSYPDSQFIPDAYVQIGEYWFGKNESFKALQAYQRASFYKDSKNYPYTVYKLAWCWFNIGEYGKAIETMKRVRVHDPNSQLQQAALLSLARFYEEAR